MSPLPQKEDGEDPQILLDVMQLTTVLLDFGSKQNCLNK